MIKLSSKTYAIVSTLLIGANAATQALMGNDTLSPNGKMIVMWVSLVVATLMKQVAEEPAK